MAVELKIPEAGESVTEVQIGEWFKGEGDYVREDEAVCEVETDKASMELPAPASGVLTKRMKEAGEIVKVGTVIALIEEGEAPPAEARPPAAKEKTAAGKGESQAEAGDDGRERAERQAAPPGEPRVMPAARRALDEAGLKASDVDATGPGGRLLKEDVERHLAGKTPAPRTGATGEAQVPPRDTGETPAPQPGAAGSRPAAGVPSVVGNRQEERVPMTMLRRRIAQRLVQSQQSTASLTTFNEVDLTAVLELRRQRNDEFQKQYGIKLGIMSFFVKAAIDALKRQPIVNAEIRDNDIVYKNYFDIGVAVSTDQGLVVPVIRNAERLSFAETEQVIADLAQRARDRKITVEELQGGTFTITNGGVFGSLLATPIINPPQSAILGMHAIQERPVARDGQVVIRPMMYIALTYDHRIIDGRESVTFLKRIKECVEAPPRMLIEV